MLWTSRFCSFLIGSGMTCFRETEKELDNRQAVSDEGHPVKTMKVESLLSGRIQTI